MTSAHTPSPANPTLPFQAYVINLKNATQRWSHMQQALQRVDIPYTRVEAVYGDQLPEPIQSFNEKRFNILTGKQRNLREIGCYLSHINALQQFLLSTDSHALILEDDVDLPETLPQLLTQAISHSAQWDLLRLTSSRQGRYLTIAPLNQDYDLAYNTRVLKNTGAYLINRTAAQACVDKMLPMCLPYDVALDRDWDYGFKTACIVPFPIKLEDFPGQIPKAPRIRRYRATTFHLFHILTRYQRIKHRKRYAHQAGII
jgi:glycosyl transferase family 25